ncbi:MAG: 50S ribosomal protein L30 [Gammaproteobacteria bacterium]|nr:50S ribosomal protein L30 [Gammaproteobacteria bacterium]
MSAQKAEKKAAKSAQQQIRVTLVRSIAGRLKNHRACVAGLGLRRVGHTVSVEDTPSVRGMINTVYYLVKVEGE